MLPDYQVFCLTRVTTRIVYKKGLKTLTTRIVYKIRGSSFLKKNLNLEWIKNANRLETGIKNEHRSNPFEAYRFFKEKTVSLESYIQSL